MELLSSAAIALASSWEGEAEPFDLAASGVLSGARLLVAGDDPVATDALAGWEPCVARPRTETAHGAYQTFDYPGLPGATALTVMFFGPNSAAMNRTYCSPIAFAAPSAA